MILPFTPTISIARIITSAYLAVALLIVLASSAAAQGAPAQSNAQSRERGVLVKQSGIAPDGRGKLWAVVIGISTYRNVPPESQLKYAHRDAEEFANFLRSPGGGGFPSTQIKLLLNEQATVSSMRTMLGTWLPRSAGPDDIVYIFFAGHGVVESERDGYLLAHDSDPQNLYATALPIAELDNIITTRLRARITVVMADACHSGKIGWTSRATEREVLIGRYLDEIGKSGPGVFRLLATRPDERSYEDTRWGGGHGAFTYFMLEGLKGKADRDKDGVIRAAELIDFLGEVVPEETRALQHPQVAGNIDPRLPLAIIASNAASAPRETRPAETHSLEVRGVPGSEVYVNSAYRGRIRPNGTLVIEGLKAGPVEISLDAPGAQSVAQSVSLMAARTVIDFRAALPPAAEAKSSPLVAEINQALSRGQVLEPGGGWALYRKLVETNPAEPQRINIETSLSSALEEIGQRAINDYINASVTELSPRIFRDGAEAFARLKVLRPTDAQLEPKHLFCEGRALIIEGRIDQAIDVLKRAVEMDQRAAHSFNALGIAYEKANKQDKAKEAFERATELAPRWSLPRSHLGIQHYLRGQWERAEQDFKESLRLDPRLGYMRLMLVRLYRERERYSEAEAEAVNLVRQSPRYPPVYIELGLLYEKSGQHAKAADAFETYLRLDPNSKDADAVRQRAAKNRRQGDRRQPQLKRP